jgi:hypothetical protein
MTWGRSRWKRGGGGQFQTRELGLSGIDIDVNRAMGTAIMAIDLLRAQLARRALLPESVGKTWTEEEEQHLRNEFAEGMDVEEIAKAHHRTVRAIETRAVMRDLMKAKDRITDNAFSEPARKKRDKRK